MAGRDGTYNYTSGPATFALKFSGMAPGAYIMSYRLDGDSAEFLAAIEDVVADQADALNISLGHSRWLTTDPAHDPIREALDAAVDAGDDRGRVVRQRRRERRQQHHRLVQAEPEDDHGREQLARARVLERGDGHRAGHAARDADGRPGVPASAPAPPIASTISGRVRRRTRRRRRERRRGLRGVRAGSLTGKIPSSHAATARST